MESVTQLSMLMIAYVHGGTLSNRADKVPTRELHDNVSERGRGMVGLHVGILADYRGCQLHVSMIYVTV